MLFRILPVMVWSFTGTLIGTAMAILDGREINWRAFLLVLSLSSIIQGYPTHIVNEIFDWKSGADSHEIGVKKFGGSKVLQAGLLKIKDLWFAFTVSHLILGLLIFLCVRMIDDKVVYFFILPGYLSGLFYSLPPLRFAYRPFLGEWLGGFAGMFFLALGSYYAQVRLINLHATILAFGVGLLYIGIMIFFHYLDYENDQMANPMKKTTVVFLGLKGSRNYASVCLIFSALCFLIWGIEFRVEGLILLLLSMILLVSHNRTNLQNELSIIKWGKVITIATLAAGICFASVSDPILFSMGLPVFIAFWLHKKFGKLKTVNLQIS